MVGRECGKNMVFREFARFNTSCVDKCVCADKFVEYDTQCLRYIWYNRANNGNNNDYLTTVSFVIYFINKISSLS